MFRQTALLILISCGGVLSAGRQDAQSILHAHREATSDLEVSGLVRGLPSGESRFVTREWLLSLPQFSLIMQQSPDFPGIPKTGVPVSGVSLDSLARSIGADAAASAIEAICLDGYTATYTREYIHRHSPFLVLRIEGLSLHEWSLKNQQFDGGPYLIGYNDFVPAFRVLSHEDERLEPTGVARLRFETEEAVYGGIQPKTGSGGPDTPVAQGYEIARQNCFRCHNAGDHGGTKGGKNWHTLGVLASNKPRWFAAWVHDPHLIDPKSEMPANPAYDKATLHALQRYFATFAKEGQ